MKGKTGHKASNCLPKTDVGGMGAKKLPTKPLKGADKAKSPTFKTGKTG